MAYPLIKLFHLVGIMLVFLGLGGMVFAARIGLGPGAKGTCGAPLAIIHGIGLLFILASGISMASSIGLFHGDPPNFGSRLKFGIFLLLGGSISLAARVSRLISAVDSALDIARRGGGLPRACIDPLKTPNARPTQNVQPRKIARLGMAALDRARGVGTWPCVMVYAGVGVLIFSATTW